MDTLLVLLAVFFGLAMVVRVPVAFSLGIGGVAVFLFKGLPNLNMAQAAFSALDSFPLLAIPLFMIAGTIMEYSGISTGLLNWLDIFIGKVKGRLGALTIVGSMAFGAITGSAMATIAAIGRIMSPDMIENGYKKSYVAALLASTCFLGILIPPSIPGIMYGIAASVNIAEVWMSTVGPGILFGIGYMILNYFYIGRREVIEKTEKLPLKKYLSDSLNRTIAALPALGMVILIFGGIYGGIFTPTEAGGISAIYGLIYFVLRRRFGKGNTTGSLRQIMLVSNVATITICVLVIFATVASRGITLGGISEALSNYIVNNIKSSALFLLFVNLVYLLMGTFLDINCSILLMTPMFLPAAKMLGIDPIHFGAISLVNLSLGMMTPPFAAGIFMACKITGEDFVTCCKAVVPFFIVGLIVLSIVTYVPWVSLFIPSLLQ